MKGRIVLALVQLSEGKNQNLKEILEKEINNQAINISERAQRVLESILHDYSGFAVSTIDSFFSRMVRSLAKELQLPLKFEMEMNQEFITGKLTSMLMADIGKTEALTQWLQQFVFTKMEEEKGWNIEHEIRLIAKELFTDRQFGNTSDEREINLVFIGVLKKIRSSFEKQMKDYGAEFISTINAAGLNVEDFAYGKSGIAGYFSKIQQGLSGDKWKPTDRLLDGVTSAGKWAALKSPKRNEIIALATARLIPLAEKTISFFDQHFKDYISASEVLAMSYLAGIVNYLKVKLTAYRDENDVLMISDNNKLLKEFIGDHDTPFIYEKTGNKFKNYLVDEFQDTSSLQWNNLLPLVINGLASGGFVMLVGDAKQSIYRWRGGNMKLLLETIHQDLLSFQKLKKTRNLDTNYRSRKEIVDFNNGFFSQAPSLLPLSDARLAGLAYVHTDTIQQILEKKSSHGFVSVSLLPKTEETEEGESQKWKAAALKQMTDTIIRCQAQGYELQDIALLVRWNKEGKEIADHLFKNGFKKITSAESLLLVNAPQVVFLINALTVLAWPDNKPAVADIIYFYNRLILKNTIDLHELFENAGEAVMGKSIFLPEKWNSRFEKLAVAPLYGLVEELIDIFGLNKNADAYMQRFQDLMLDFSSKNQGSIKDFLTWWEEHKDNEKLAVVSPDNKDAINIISIHRSKGLQFPVVIMPFASWNFKPKSHDILWINSTQEPYAGIDLFPVRFRKNLQHSHFAEAYQRELDESLIDNLNLLYVAFTRAEEKLFVCSVINDVAEKEIYSVDRLLHAVIHRDEKWSTLVKNTGGGLLLQIGEDHDKLITGEKSRVGETGFEAPSAVTMPAYTFNRWQDKLNIRVSGIVHDKEDTAIAARDFGLMLHETMSLIRHRTDRKKALEKVSAQHLLTMDEIAHLENELDLIFSLTTNEKWFDDDWCIMNEAEMITPDGTLLRPDRVMIRDRQAIVIDYKTGAREEKHRKQVSDYGQALQEMGYEQVSGFLLYLQEKMVVPV